MLSTIRKRVDNMGKLNSFRNNNKQKNIIIVETVFLIGLILVGISYAVYQKEDEIKFIDAKVGEFETSSSDIELAMKLDGEDIETPPSKSDGYYNVTIECDHAEGNWDMDEWLAKIGNITSNKVKCNVNFESYEKSIQDVELGDYIRMTPTSTSYTPLGSDTGCLNDSNCTQNTINPSELNLWRVIRKNDDGTVEVVSEYVSSNKVWFYAQVGYMNLVGGLNTIASQYSNSKYVSRTRHMGYSNQIEKCKTLSVTACPNDTGYKTDENLVIAATGTKEGKLSSGKSGTYWYPSRFITYYNNGTYYNYCARHSKDTGDEHCSYLLAWEGSLGYFSGLAHMVRPILTLKKDITIVSGNGKSAATSYKLD